MIIAHVDMDTFFVAVERLRDPSLVGKPVVVGGHTGRGVVCAASYEARKFGVHSAMPMARALKLCPQAVVVSRDHAKYSEASKKAMRVLEKYAPAVEPVSIDEAYLDLTGTERLLGPPFAVAHEIRQALETTLQLSASIGIGQSRVSAKIASGLAKPAGILWVLAGQDSKFLAPLAVSRMPGIGPKAEARLKSLGVRTLGDLAAFPLESLRRRFGGIAQELQERARGVDSTPIRAATAGDEEAPKSIGRETTFEEDTADRDFLRAIVGYLGEDVGERLRREGRLASTVTVKIRFADFETHTRGRTLPESTDLNQEIVFAALDLLEEFLKSHPKGMGFRLLGVTVSNFSLPSSQLALFSDQRKRLRQLDEGVDHLRERYGFDKLVRGRTLPLLKKPRLRGVLRMKRKRVAIGEVAPSFDLPGVDGKNYSLKSFQGKKAVVVMFTCNHCPTVQAYEERLVAIQRDYADKGVQLVAINANESVHYPEDNFDNMVKRAKAKGYNFPYLRDETQQVAKAFGAAYTPEIFVLDEGSKLRYTGRIDDNKDYPKKAKSHDLRSSLDTLLEGKEIPNPETVAFGCTIKWA